MRRKPYTTRGIKRIPCTRCGEPSSCQWNVCSMDNVYKGVCLSCDIALNELVLDFFCVEDKEQKMKDYIVRLKDIYGVDTGPIL